MKKIFKIFQFLKEGDQFSNARLLSFLTCCSFIVDWQKHIWAGMEFNPSPTIVGIVLGVVGCKVIQKFAEVKQEAKQEVAQP